MRQNTTRQKVTAKKATAKSPVRPGAKRPIATPRVKKAPVAPPPVDLCPHCEVELPTAEARRRHMIQKACGVYLTRANLDPTTAAIKSFTSKAGDDWLAKGAGYLAPPTKDQSERRCLAMVAIGTGSKTVLELRRTEDAVTFIPHSSAGFAVERLRVSSFDEQYRPMPDYPTGRAAKLFVGMALETGGTGEAMSELAKLVLVTEEEVKMAITKLAGNKATEMKTVTKDAGKHGKVQVEARRGKRETASSLYKGLLMEGGRTADEINAKVKAAFPDQKATHAGWYRSQMCDGRWGPEFKNPPPFKTDKPQATEKATTAEKTAVTKKVAAPTTAKVTKPTAKTAAKASVK